MAVCHLTHTRLDERSPKVGAEPVGCSTSARQVSLRFSAIPARESANRRLVSAGTGTRNWPTPGTSRPSPAARTASPASPHGILAKIGVNDAGVGVLFNILGHQDDGVGAVPVHLVARRVLGEAGSFEHALALLADAPVSASTVLTVVTADRTASVELSPAGSAVVHPDAEGWLVRTNHFLAPGLAAGELRGRREPETYDRHRVLSRRVLGRAAPAGPGELLTAHGDEDGAQVCCHAPDGGEPGSRWPTLATVALDVAGRRLALHKGGPCSAGPATWTSVTATTR
ncbi:C45 family autoproteolytic acyltransferase/hydolase [Streptomyces sp. NPDC014006]|uniref:C45 family autoproteolytic acyltransferase/hydolase n=1 Tax=Streptomyces sp. NPDC014006 TaxID=3364870 RepID=UPI0036F9EC5E